MQNFFVNIWDKLKNLNDEQNKKTKMIVISAILLVVFVVGGIFLFGVLSPYEVLFTGLNDDELTEITAKLREMNVEMKTSSDGTILVPSDVEPTVKVQLVSEGYPKSGFTYGYFTNNIGLMTTDSDKDFYKLADLQERLAATIKLFNGIKDAKVTIAIAEETKYVLETDKGVNSAAVTIITTSGETPSSEQVLGIQRLVAKSIPNLEMENVVVVDGYGIEVSSSTQETSQLTSSTLKLQLEQEFEAAARQKILHLLTPIYGEDKIRVAVKTTVDVDKKLSEIIEYTPSEDNKGVVSNEYIYQESDGSTTDDGGSPGTDENADVPTYDGVTTDGDTYIFKDEKQYEYLVSQVREQIESDAGNLVNTTIGITLDGIDLNADRLNSMKRLVANATGVAVADANDKIEILSSPFLASADEGTPDVDGDIVSDLLNMSLPALVAIGVALLLCIVFIIIAVLYRIKAKKLKKLLLQQQGEHETLSSEQDEPIQIEEVEEIQQKNREKLEYFKLGQVRESREKKLQTEISNFAAENPEVSAQLIKNWLRGGDVDESDGN